MHFVSVIHEASYLVQIFTEGWADYSNISHNNFTNFVISTLPTVPAVTKTFLFFCPPYQERLRGRRWRWRRRRWRRSSALYLPILAAIDSSQLHICCHLFGQKS